MFEYIFDLDERDGKVTTHRVHFATSQERDSFDTALRSMSAHGRYAR